MISGNNYFMLDVSLLIKPITESIQLITISIVGEISCMNKNISGRQNYLILLAMSVADTHYLD